MIDDCTAVILAGGESRRMGRDKASTPFRGRPLWQHVHERIAPMFARTMFSVRAGRADLPADQVEDVFAGRGPMTGIASALTAVETAWVFVAGCDMPFISPGLVHFMAGHREGHHAVVVEAGGRLQPLPGFYAAAALPLMRAAIARGERGLVRLLSSQLDARALSGSLLPDPERDLQSFTDCDTPQSLRMR